MDEDNEDYIPKRLVLAGIKGYSSNLKPGDSVAFPVKLFFELFGDELIERLTKTADSDEEKS